MAMARTSVLLTLGLVGMLVGACSSEDDASDALSGSSSSVVVTTQSVLVEPTTTVMPDAPAEPVVSEYLPTETTESAELPSVVEESVIVDCQMGLGPIVTYWSDGTVTGYSDYCQSVHDQALQGEIDANTPICDGPVCVYPNGAEIANPNYTVVRTPSPWVQGQIDWQNCLEAGNSEEFCRSTLN
ncbi:hypothetical protein [Rhodococcoides corynebacterioides]|uniref:Secreted protein n=1 Tax=Rhodococcoides corynebacterioides TaxID=53972 RepID=A0ABS7P5T4_9NOCA|nr:hypothetical protein [Rhodococcus corynebacterioides]MBY6366546.1 hypothetical protein [Rhodococcus corynebacterioides]MBY6408085.1 hypothetical protein [Rhodococcus corynebacterioides]